MKTRLRLVAWLAALLLLAGCASQTNSSIQPVTTGFSCQAAIHYRDLELVSQLTCTADGGVKTTFVLPKSLNGITLGWNGTDMTMELGDATIALPAEKVPESALIRLLLQVLTAKHPSGSKSGEGYVVSGEVEGKAYTMVYDTTTGFLKSISVPDEQLSATFTQVKRIV